MTTTQITRTKQKNEVTLNQVKKQLDEIIDLLQKLTEQDPEGEYKPEFVRRMLKSRKEKKIYTFTDKETFLKTIQNA